MVETIRDVYGIKFYTLINCFATPLLRFSYALVSLEFTAISESLSFIYYQHTWIETFACKELKLIRISNETFTIASSAKQWRFSLSLNEISLQEI